MAESHDSPSPQANPAERTGRRQFLARAFTAAAVLVVPGAITATAPSIALAQDPNPKDPKHPEPTRTSDYASPPATFPPISPTSSPAPYYPQASASKTNLPGPSASPRPITSPSPSTAPNKADSTRTKQNSSKGVDFF